jgi:hypothetical protein
MGRSPRSSAGRGGAASLPSSTGTGASHDVPTRAIPVLTLVFLTEVLGAAKSGWPWWANLPAVVAGFDVLVGAWSLANRIRERPAPPVYLAALGDADRIAR